MKIFFKWDVKKIIGGNEWEIKCDRNTLIFQNIRHRFTGNLDESRGTITGIWENMTASGEWKYWYDKTFNKTDKIKLK